jgi:c-di-GMP-binding flagellar brake protein YcgR
VVNSIKERSLYGLSATGRLLVRSPSEMYRTLEAIRASQDTVTATLDSGRVFFTSRLLHVDEALRFIVLRWSEHRPANSVLLAAVSALFHCSHGDKHIEFVTGDPREMDYGGKRAIRTRFPTLMLALHRRIHPRQVVPTELPLRCKIPLDGKVHEATVTDISLGGVGMLVYETDERIDPGTLIEHAIVLHPQGRRIVVDLEVRHVARVLLPNGRPVFRTGCRLFSSPEEIEILMSLFARESC